MPPTASPWRRHALLLLAPWALALLAYGNSFRAELVFDNNRAIVLDQRIHAATYDNARAIVSGGYWYKLAGSGLYRPLTTLSYLFNYAILGSGPNPASYHWVNFLLHAINILLVYLLGLKLFEQRGNKERLAVAMATVWAVHPVLTESITNVVGRADLLAAVGILGGLLCHMKSVSASGRAKWVWLGALSLTAAVGIFSKESGVVVVAALLIYDLVYRRPILWRSWLPSYLALTPPLAVFFYVRHEIFANLIASIPVFGDNPLVGADFWTARLTAVKVLGKYLLLLVWPGGLSCDYAYNQVPLVSGWADWQALAALAACVAVAGLSLVFYRGERAILFFCGFAFANLAPTANLAFPIGTIMAERFLYLPAIAFAGCLVLALDAAPRRVGVAVVGAICLAFAVRTYVRNADWENELSLWSSAVKVSPRSYRTHMALAYWLINAQTPDSDRIERELKQTLAILDPLPDERNEAPAYATAGLWYRKRGDARKALELLQRAERIDRAAAREIEAQNRSQGKTVTNTGWATLYLELGRTYLLVSEPGKAVEAFEYGRRLDPGPEYSAEMAKAYRAMGDGKRAAIALMEGLMLDPGQAGFASELVDVYRESEPGSCAIVVSGGASTINLGCPLVQRDLCTASRNVADLHRRAGRIAEAGRASNTAIREFGCPAEMFR
jgi:tetratricopeptide (TPR) repeat protein